MGESSKAFPIVSVIVPAFNAEQHLPETLNSVLAQTFSDFEVIIADDGSRDGTATIAEQFAAKDARIHVLRQPNHGISVARNAAMAASRGEYLALLDSDDIWRPEYLAEQLRVLTERPDVDIISANAYNLGGTLDGTVWKTTAPGIHQLSLETIIRQEQSVSIFSVFRRSVYEQVGAFDEALTRNEDYDFWLRAALQGAGIAFNSVPLGWYRRRSDSLSADEAKMLLGIQRPLRKLLTHFPSESPLALVIDEQLNRYERDRLRLNATVALLRGNFSVARDHFRTLHANTGTLTHGVVAFVADVAPSLLVWAFWLKRSAQRALCAMTLIRSRGRFNYAA